MNSLNYFQKFVTKKVIEENTNLSVWSYTRVSSKDQYDKNASVERQQEVNQEYAAIHKYQITEYYGGNYESGKSDEQRKEFSRLIERVESARKKPYAILVYKVSRFSRSGGAAIGLLDYLVKYLGVHLIETSSGLSTVSERDRMTIYDELSQAYRENVIKKEWVIPSMIASLKAGNWTGIAPLGYDQYGRKVREERRFAFKQRIEINKDGELLKEAWQWKVSGMYSDAQIIAKLEARGLRVIKQKLSQLWRNPFYCGILINSLLDEPVKGNWQPLVSHDDFIRVQYILDRNPAGFSQNKNEDERPLSRLLKCNDCGCFMVGYKNNKKNLHYYRCLKCNGVSMNAFTTPRAKKIGAHDLFVEFLKKFTLADTIIPLVKMQLTKLFNHYNFETVTSDKAVRERLETLEKQVKDLKIRHALGEIDKEMYDLTHAHLFQKIGETTKELNTLTRPISNLEKLIVSSLKKLRNLSTIWTSADLENKRRIQNTLFPDGVFYCVKNHQYLTKSLNAFLSLTAELASDSDQKEKGLFNNNVEKSYLAPPVGLEPTTL